jgi:hypothetical protein
VVAVSAPGQPRQNISPESMSAPHQIAANCAAVFGVPGQVRSDVLTRKESTTKANGVRFASSDMDEIALLDRGSINLVRNQHRNEVTGTFVGSKMIAPVGHGLPCPAKPVGRSHSETLQPRQRCDSFPREMIDFPF